MLRSLVRMTTALLAVSIIAGGCSAAAAGSIGDREFLSVAVTDGGAPKQLVPGTRIRLTFAGDDLGAQAGCNSIGGTYRIDGGRLVFAGGSMTEMGCGPERHAQDDWLVDLLDSSPTVRLNGDELVLESGSTLIRLMDRTVVEPDANMVGPTWKLVSIIDGDAVSSIPDGQGATLKFGADGTVEVFAGCNRGGGTWSAVGAGIEVGPIGLTKMACDGPSATIEAAVLEVLEAGSIAASIKSDILTLQAGGNGLQLQAT
jgi:heat shock protein HslJ